MKNLYLLVMLLTTLTTFSQITFEKGYIINNKGEKQTGLIKNDDWRFNPTFIEFKEAVGSPVQKIGINDIKAFEIYNNSKYERHNVNIDRSSDNIMNMGTTRNPEFQDETLFLKVLVEGNANLYQYTAPNLKRFFYKVGNKPVTQLIYKKYKVDVDLIKTNNNFRQQLLNSFHCPSFNLNTFKNLNYKKRELVNLFVKYNKCKNSDYSIKSKEGNSIFRIWPKIQIRNASVLMRNPTEDQSHKFDAKTYLAFGLELEYTFPFNKNKWALTFEPTYHNYSQTLEVSKNIIGIGKTVTVRHIYYPSIELPFGIKYNMFLNNHKSRVFADIAVNYDIPLSNARIDFEKKDYLLKSLEVKSLINFSLGIGYAQKNFSVEVRFYNKRNITTNYLSWKTEYSNISLVLGYKIFEKHF